jgi:hypothetical protein
VAEDGPGLSREPDVRPSRRRLDQLAQDGGAAPQLRDGRAVGMGLQRVGDLLALTSREERGRFDLVAQTRTAARVSLGGRWRTWVRGQDLNL